MNFFTGLHIAGQSTPATMASGQYRAADYQQYALACYACVLVAEECPYAKHHAERVHKATHNARYDHCHNIVLHALAKRIIEHARYRTHKYARQEAYNYAEKVALIFAKGIERRKYKRGYGRRGSERPYYKAEQARYRAHERTGLGAEQYGGYYNGYHRKRCHYRPYRGQGAERSKAEHGFYRRQKCELNKESDRILFAVVHRKNPLSVNRGGIPHNDAMIIL